VFIGATPDIIYAKDTNGDGVADIREVVFTGFRLPPTRPTPPTNSTFQALLDFLPLRTPSSHPRRGEHVGRQGASRGQRVHPPDGARASPPSAPVPLGG
jgi:hypothetical protein